MECTVTRNMCLSRGATVGVCTGGHRPPGIWGGGSIVHHLVGMLTPRMVQNAVGLLRGHQGLGPGSRLSLILTAKTDQNHHFSIDIRRGHLWVWADRLILFDAWGTQIQIKK